MKANYTNQFFTLVFSSILMFVCSTNLLANSKVSSLVNENKALELASSEIISALNAEEPTYDLWYGYDGENGFTPNSTQYIQVASATTVTLTGDLEVAGLLLSVDSELNLNGFTLTINDDDIETNGGKIVASASNSKILFSGASQQNFDASSIKDNLLWELGLNNPSQLSITNNLKITKLLKIAAGDLNVSAASLTFACQFNTSSIQTAQIDQVPATSEIIGDVDVEQCFEARRAWRFVGSPVNTTGSIHANWQEGTTAYSHDPVPGFGVHITGLGFSSMSPTYDTTNGFDWNPSGNPSMFVWNKDNQFWSQVDNTNLNTLQSGDAYRLMVRGDRTTDITSSYAAPSPTKLSTYGSMSVGTQDFSNQFSPYADHFAFIANPYQAVVDLHQVYQDATNISEIVMIWDPWLGGVPEPGQPGGRGAWITYNLSSGVDSNSDSEFDGFLQPYQAAVFKTKNNEAVSLQFKEEHKAINQTTLQTFSVEENENKTLQVQLYTQEAFNANSTSSDAFVIHFTDDGYNGIDYRDAPKMDNVDENFARFHNGNLLVVENRAYPVTDENLGLFINQFSCDDYTVKLNVPEFEDVDMKLIDYYTGITHDLDEGINLVSFSVDASNASRAYNRFSLSFEQITLNTSTFEDENAISLYPNPVQLDYLYVELPQSLNGDISVEIFDVQGRKVNAKVYENQTSNSLKIENLNLNSGVYFLNIKGEQKLNTTVKFIKA